MSNDNDDDDRFDLMPNENDNGDELDLSQYIQEIEELDKDVERTDEEEKARNAKRVTNGHDTRGLRVEKSFLDGIAKIGTL